MTQMSNFHLTPQYELFVEAKLAFIINALMPLQMEDLECLQTPQLVNAVGLFTDSFTYHAVPYGTAAACSNKQVDERRVFNANYALRVVEATGQALAWNSRQASLSGELVRVLHDVFEDRASPRSDSRHASYWGVMERVWRFLVTAPRPILTIIGNMRFKVPVGPTAWREITETTPSQVTMTGLLGELYKEGFVWPNSPITFIPTAPFDESRENLYHVVVRPGNMTVSRENAAIPRMTLVYNIMRELFGHITSDIFKIPFGVDESFVRLSSAVEQEFGNWDNVPDWDFLSAIRELLNDFRCSDGRVTFDGAQGGTLVTLIEFMDRLRNYQDDDKSSIGLDAVTSRVVDLIVSPNRSHFQLLQESFPPFENVR